MNNNKFALTPPEYAALYMRAEEEIRDTYKRYGNVVPRLSKSEVVITARDMWAVAALLTEHPRERPDWPHSVVTRIPPSVNDTQYVRISWDAAYLTISVKVKAEWLRPVMTGSRPNKDAPQGLRFDDVTAKLLEDGAMLLSNQRKQDLLIDFIITFLNR